MFPKITNPAQNLSRQKWHVPDMSYMGSQPPPRNIKTDVSDDYAKIRGSSSIKVTRRGPTLFRFLPGEVQ